MKLDINLHRALISVWVTGLMVFCGPETITAQTDSITLISGRPLRGTVESSTSEKIVVATSDGRREIEPWNIRRIRFDGQNELARAKTAYADDRLNVCLQDLQAFTDTSGREIVKQELAFYLAMSAAKIALQGGNVAPEQAAASVNQFVQNYPGSFHLFEAIDTLGDLAIALGRFDVAVQQFGKTAVCPWPEISINGKLKGGKAQLLNGNPADAMTSFKAVQSDQNAEDYAVQTKLIAKCLLAKALALNGDPVEGRRLAHEIIRKESSKNSVLFAHAYNALGTCFQKEDNTKEAIQAFLHTDLLFTTEPESHAEALFHLVQLWQQAERPDRASRARQKISQRYRNTYWASKLQ